MKKRGIKIVSNKTGRRIRIIGPDGEALLRLGIGDKQWRLTTGGLTEIVSSKEIGLYEARKWVDDRFNRSEHRRLCRIAKEGELDYTKGFLRMSEFKTETFEIEIKRVRKKVVRFSGVLPLAQLII